MQSSVTVALKRRRLRLNLSWCERLYSDLLIPRLVHRTNAGCFGNTVSSNAGNDDRIRLFARCRTRFNELRDRREDHHDLIGNHKTDANTMLNSEAKLLLIGCRAQRCEGNLSPITEPIDFRIGIQDDRHVQGAFVAKTFCQSSRNRLCDRRANHNQAIFCALDQLSTE
jgi:hypothetical protein